MLVRIAPLSRVELNLLLSALKAADPKDKLSDGQLWDLEKRVEAYVKNSRGRIRVSRVGFQWREPGRTNVNLIQNDWHEAARRFLQNIVEDRNMRGLYCPMPTIALPFRNPMVLLNNRDQFIDWLVARSVANAQWLRFVKCLLCKKLALRDRAKAESRYCSKACQKKANLASVLREKQEDFETWLRKQDELPPSLELELMNIQQLKQLARNPLKIKGVSARVEKTGGTLAGGQKPLYFFIVADKNGVLGQSNTIRATIPPDTNTNKVTLSGPNPFGPDAVRYQVWRIVSKEQNQKKRIPISNFQKVDGRNFEFTDDGLRSVQRASSYEPLTLSEIPEFCPACKTDGVAQPLAFCEELKSRGQRQFRSVWLCTKCGQVVRKG